MDESALEIHGGVTRRTALGVAALVGAAFALPSVLTASSAAAAVSWFHPFPSRGTIDDGFGARNPHPITGGPSFHNGLDYGPPWSGPIYSVASGTVLAAGWTDGWGNRVLIDHGSGFRSLYAHMQDGSIRVSSTQAVGASTLVGTIGSTGPATGDHLHVEIHYNGSPVDPAPYIHNAPLAGTAGSPNGDDMTTYTPIIFDRSRPGVNDEAHPDFASTGIVVGDRFIRTSVGRAPRGMFDLSKAAFSATVGSVRPGGDGNGDHHADINMLTALMQLST